MQLSSLLPESFFQAGNTKENMRLGLVKLIEN
jgi:hypothetical protein